MHPTIRQQHRSYGQQQWCTSRPHQQTHRAVTYGTEVSTEKQDHDQQHEQHQCRY